MDNLLVKWNGPQKIKGIIALRTVFDLGLKEALALVSSDEGFVVSPLQWLALRGEYMLKMTTASNTLAFPEVDAINDWLVENYVQALPAWLVDKHVREDILKDR